MNVYYYELRAARIKTVLWIAAIVAMSALYLSVYPAFSKDATALQELFAKLPPAMHHVLGVGDMKLFSFLGFFGNIFPFITLVGAIQAASIGLGLLSKEPALKMSDFLLTKPQTRQYIYWQKVLAGATQLIITEVLVTIAAFFIAGAVNAGSFDTTQFMMFWGAFTLIQFFMFSLGLLISQVVKKIKTVAAPALGMSFGFFLLAILAVILGDDTIRWVTPFRFIDYKKIVTDAAYDPAHIAYGLALVLIFTSVSYSIYTRRDVPAAI